MDINGNPIDPNRKYIRKQSQNTYGFNKPSMYKISSTIILRGKPITEERNKEAKLLEFLSKPPVSFEKGDQ